MATVRKGEVQGDEGRSDNAPALSPLDTRIQNIARSIGYVIPSALIVGIFVAFAAGLGSKLWQRAYQLGRWLV